MVPILARVRTYRLFVFTVINHWRRVRRRERQRVEYTWTMDPKFSLTTSPVLTPQLKALLLLYLINAITSDPWTQAIQPPNYMRQEFMFVLPTVNNNNRTEVSIHRGRGT